MRELDFHKGRPICPFRLVLGIENNYPRMEYGLFNGFIMNLTKSIVLYIVNCYFYIGGERALGGRFCGDLSGFLHNKTTYTVKSGQIPTFL